jgi:hypothetical protein
VAGSDWHCWLAGHHASALGLLLLTVFLVASAKLQLRNADRMRVTVISGFVVLSYFTLVYLIFYLTYTPPDVDHLRGFKGASYPYLPFPSQG